MALVMEAMEKMESILISTPESARLPYAAWKRVRRESDSIAATQGIWRRSIPLLRTSPMLTDARSARAPANAKAVAPNCRRVKICMDSLNHDPLPHGRGSVESLGRGFDS